MDNTLYPIRFNPFSNSLPNPRDKKLPAFGCRMLSFSSMLNILERSGYDTFCMVNLHTYIWSQNICFVISFCAFHILKSPTASQLWLFVTMRAKRTPATRQISTEFRGLARRSRCPRPCWCQSWLKEWPTQAWRGSWMVGPQCGSHQRQSHLRADGRGRALSAPCDHPKAILWRRVVPL
jgi:hypothetical protein